LQVTHPVPLKSKIDLDVIMGNKLLSTCQEFMDSSSPTTTKEVVIVCVRIQAYLVSCEYQFLEQDFVSAFDLANLKLIKIESDVTEFKRFESIMFVNVLFLLGLILFEMYFAHNAVIALILLCVAVIITLLIIYKERKLMPP
jgi:uncharacterized membrane protein